MSLLSVQVPRAWDLKRIHRSVTSVSAMKQITLHFPDYMATSKHMSEIKYIEYEHMTAFCPSLRSLSRIIISHLLTPHDAGTSTPQRTA